MDLVCTAELEFRNFIKRNVKTNVMNTPWFFSGQYKGSILVIFMLLLVCYHVEAQKTETEILSKNIVYADVGGHFAGQVSVNFESCIYTGEKLSWYGRGGVGAAGIIMANGGMGVLGGITMLTGKGNRHFEINGGAFVGKDVEQDEVFVYPLIDFGYRYQKPEGGFIFRAKAGFLGIGIGLGYAF